MAVPFPQANDPQKIIDLVVAVSQGMTLQEDIARHFDFSLRQADYYGNAAVYLGLLERIEGGFTSTAQTHQFSRAHRRQRIADLIRRISALPVFGRTLQTARAGAWPSKQQIAHDIQGTTEDVNDTTAWRRASTVLRWVSWALDQN